MPKPVIVKPYFPMVLSNGLDVVLVDYSGSMHCDSGHCHLEQHQDAHAGWQKNTHRARTRRLLAVPYFPYRVLGADGEVFEVGDFEQTFDPYTATIVTEAHTHILHLRITGCLTGDGVYAERFEVLYAVPGARLALLAKKMAPPEVAQISYAAGEGAEIRGTYTLDGWQGTIRVAVQAQKPVVQDTKSACGWLEVGDLQAGDTVDRFITVQDTSHVDDPQAACAATLAKATSAGFTRVHAAHAAEWAHYQGRTRVTIPDPELERMYRTSLYLLRASQHPNGFVTHGIYDVLWGGGAACTWDITFFMRAWLSSNQLAPAKKLADFYQDVAAPPAREYAAQIDRPGVNYPWFMNTRGIDLFFEDAIQARGVQKWNICCMVLQFFDLYRFTGDEAELRRRLPIAREALDFLLAEIVDRDGDRWIIANIEGADENIDRLNDTAHLLTLVKGLADYSAACDLLGLPRDAKYVEAHAGLSAAMALNFKDGMMLPWYDAEAPSTEAFTLYCLNVPEGINHKTVRYAYTISQGAWGMTNAGTFPNLVWPWTECRAAVALSVFDPALAFRRLKNAVRIIDQHSLFPEKVRPDGFWIFIGYGTPHATFTWALNSLFATDNGAILSVAAGLPKSWRDFSFADIRTPSGYAVTLDVQDGRVQRLEIENTRKATRTIRLKLLAKGHPDVRDAVIELLPGKNVLDYSTRGL